MQQKQIEIKGNTYRVRKMNAIEALAIRTAGDMQTIQGCTNLFNEILERIEIQVADKWIPVKQNGFEVYLPDGIENDCETIQALIQFFMNDFLKPLFTKSVE